MITLQNLQLPISSLQKGQFKVISIRLCFDNRFSDENGIKTFNPDVPDFSLQQISYPAGTHVLPTVESASITILVSGKAKINDQHIEAGLVFYQSSNESLEMIIEEDIVAYRAFVQA